MRELNLMEGLETTTLTHFHKMLPKTRIHYGSIINELNLKLSEDFKTPKIWGHIFYKTYPRFKKIKLIPESNPKGDLFELIKKRRSRRNFQKKEISFKQLSTILNYSAGIVERKFIEKNKLDIHNPKYAKRFYASAGARYPLEIYLVINSIEGLNEGLYHYNIKENCLEEIFLGNLREEKIIIDSKNTKMQKNASFLIIMTTVLPRNELKYLELAYPLSYEEAGRIGDRIQLLTEKYSLGTCPIAGFYHDEIIRILNIDPEEEIPIMVHAVG